MLLKRRRPGTIPPEPCLDKQTLQESMAGHPAFNQDGRELGNC